jgi:hypothetical protein
MSTFSQPTVSPRAAMQAQAFKRLQGRKGKTPPLPGKTCTTGRTNDIIHAKS